MSRADCRDILALFRSAIRTGIMGIGVFDVFCFDSLSGFVSKCGTVVL